ncbi:MFS transporter [Streptomyces sp. ST2-7A]|uniref:MFS transporter n=1 Tax=Streptomyces sp. ST2-7A TaxID=2907214 RepID=UPI001F3EF90C|nr:MFS transporter [Streptomyces sp. ST2-7A]MCE7081230.1 MFS transporter [Streptomyces sp. ST2-7A]
MGRRRADGRPPTPATEAGPDPRRWKALALLCAAYFMVIVDSQIVILALPAIESDLNFSTSGVQWVLSAYLLSFGGLLLFGGRTADLLGGRRMFMFGTVLFLITSVICGLAWTSEVLVVTRIVQGVTAAIMAPTAMAVLMNTFGEGSDRNRALGIWTAIGAFGATAALLIGGVITDRPGWECIFFINIPIALVVLFLGPRLLRETPIAQGRRSFDPVGAVTITAGLALLIYVIVEAPEVGWGDATTLGLLAVAAVLIIGFIFVEQRVAQPLIPLRVFRSPTLVGGNIMMLLVAMATYGGALITSLYAQEVLGYTAIFFGLSTAVYSAMSIVGSNVSGLVATRVGFKPVAIVGMTLLGIGTLLLAQVSAYGNYFGDLFWGLLIFGIGIGIGTTVVASSIAALSGARPREAGLASGINNSVFQIGAALGIAVCSSVALAFTRAEGPAREALTEGYQAAFMATAVMAGIGLLVAVTLMAVRQSQPRPAARTTDTSQPTEEPSTVTAGQD